MYELEPLEGSGPIRIGMLQTLVEAELAKLGLYTSLRRPSGSVELFLDKPSLKVGVGAADERVEYVEFDHPQQSASRRESCPSCQKEAALSPGCDYQVVFRGLDMFHTEAEVLVEALKGDGLEGDEEGTSWVSRPLQLALWREDPSLSFFQTVLVGRDGIFS